MILLNKTDNLFLLTTFIVLLSVVSSIAQVQNNPRQVLGTTGGSNTVNLSSGQVTFDYTVGECIVTSDSTTSTSSLVRYLTQGFQQPTDTTIVIDDIHVTLHIYKGITPNGDGHNDTWIIDGITEAPGNKVTIFNRWGTLIWEKKNYNNSDIVWDGKNNNGNPLPNATYFYIIEINKKSYEGWVELTN